MHKKHLNNLRRLAEEVATWGRWAEFGNDGGLPCAVVVDNPESDVHRSVVCRAGLNMGENMEFIAAFNPVTAVALLDRIDALEKEIEALKCNAE
jgi:hypothetical protein